MMCVRPVQRREQNNDFDDTPYPAGVPSLLTTAPLEAKQSDTPSIGSPARTRVLASAPRQGSARTANATARVARAHCSCSAAAIGPSPGQETREPRPVFPLVPTNVGPSVAVHEQNQCVQYHAAQLSVKGELGLRYLRTSQTAGGGGGGPGASLPAGRATSGNTQRARNAEGRRCGYR